MENDSSFLEGAQKNIIQELTNTVKKDEVKKKIWKKLPNDFLKF